MQVHEGLSGTQIAAMGMFSLFQNNFCFNSWRCSISLKMTGDTQHLCKTVAPSPSTRNLPNLSFIHTLGLWLLLIYFPLTQHPRYWLVCPGCTSPALPSALEPCLPLVHLKEPNLPTHAFYRGWVHHRSVSAPPPPFLDRHGLCVSESRYNYGWRNPALGSSVCFINYKQML